MNEFKRGSGDGDERRGNSPRGGAPRRGTGPVPPGRPFRTLAFWMLVILLALVTVRMYQGSFMTPQRAEINYTRFIQEVNAGNIANLQIIEKTVTGELKTEKTVQVPGGRALPFKSFRANLPEATAELPERVWAKNPDIDIEVRPAGVNWVSVILSGLPLLLILGAWLFFIRQMQSGGSAAMKFGKTRAKVLVETAPKVTFKDVAGCEEAKQELQEVIEFLKEPQKFQRLGGRIPKGALLLGPPGSGKTLLARAVAGEAGVPFFSMSGSDFVEMFVGVGASVTGDTPVLVRDTHGTRLVPIGTFVDGFYQGDDAGRPVKVSGVQTLGFAEKDSKFKGSSKTFVEGSAWSNVQAVYRHRVSEIHEIEFLGGTMRTTGDHSVFVRTRDGIKPVPASELKPGDVLVQLPMKVRGVYSPATGTPHTTRAHAFDEAPEPRWLELTAHDAESEQAFAFATEQAGTMSQAAIGAAIGVSQATVGNWQSGRHLPRALSDRYTDRVLPECVEVTPRLMRLLGFYTAEGRENGCLEFTFGTHEPDFHAEVLASVHELFGVEGKVEHTADHSTKLTFHSAALGRFFARLCGTGSHEKYVPELLWDLPRPLFEAYLTGYALGDGHVTRDGKLSITSVSHTLIRELSWLCAMHGIPSGVRETHMPAGRVLKGRPLPATTAWNLIIGKTSHWLVRDRARQGKRAIVRKVTKRLFDGYVYDLCGCDNEAFFGGEKPVLLHNSRVRDLFEQGKRNAPCLTADTMITLVGGRQVTIGEMFDRRMIGARVPAMTEDLRLDDASVIGITRKPCPDLFEVTTSTSSIRATGNHLFPVLRDGRLAWVRTDELKVGEVMAMPRQIPTSSEVPHLSEFVPAGTRVTFRGKRPSGRAARAGALGRELRTRWAGIERLTLGRGGWTDSSLTRMPAYVSEDLLYVLGLLESDGWDSGGRTMAFVNTEPALHDHVARILEAEFGYRPKRAANAKRFDLLLPQGRPPATLRDSETTRIHHRLVAEVLRAIRARLLELPEPLIAAWLRGMFDGDGCVRADAHQPQVIFSAWAPDTQRAIRAALLRVGLVATVSPAAREGRDGNVVLAGREAVRAFYRKVNTDHPEKYSRLSGLLAALSGTEVSSSRRDGVPVGSLLRDARTSLGMGQRAFRLGGSVSDWERGQVCPSRDSLQSAVAILDDWREAHRLARTPAFERLEDLAHSAVLWTRIESVTPTAPVDHVYDLCLDRHHNFVANDLFTHNCIIFIDEIDAVGRHRGAGLGGGHDEREQTLNQLLVEMDGFESNEGVIMIAATNRPDVLDPALLRPGRFDRQIVVDWPDVRGREGILKVHTRKIPLGEDVDLKLIARGTPGMAGADIANLVNEAALLAARRNHKKVSLRDFEDAKDKVMLGTERRSLVMTEAERRTTAFHEAGHALVAWLLPGSDPVTKVTIIPRGRALGVTFYTPAEERHNHSKRQLEDRLVHAMGGRAAELLEFDHLTTGAANDLEQATNLARSMVTRFGMSDKLGPLTFGKKDEMVFLGRELATHKDYSEKTAVLIDEEVRAQVERAHTTAMDLLRNNRDKLELLANTLLERETLDGDEMDRVLRGEKLEPLPRAIELDKPEAPAAPDEPAAASDDSQLDAFTSPPAPKPAGA